MSEEKTVELTLEERVALLEKKCAELEQKLEQKADQQRVNKAIRVVSFSRISMQSRASRGSSRPSSFANAMCVRSVQSMLICHVMSSRLVVVMVFSLSSKS